MKTHMKTSKQRGFALVVTLSLMILLTVIAVGLLSLSSISLRSSGQANAIATAKSNARLALMLAIGELQKSLGPDKSITANSEILSATPAKPNTTGVWASWDFDPRNGSLDYSAEKASHFRSWLVSTPDPASTQNRDFANQAWTGKTIQLVGNGSLGASADAQAKATAGLVPVSAGTGKAKGSYAWHVADESVKARINLYRDPSQNQTLAQKTALSAGHRPDPSVMKRADGSFIDYLPIDLTSADFTKASASTSKITDLGQVDLLENAMGKVKPFRNDVTPYSLGVLADVRHGGLKQDLSSLFEISDVTGNGLPSEFAGKKLYASTLGITGVSDPNWGTLASYYNTFRNITKPETKPTFTPTSDPESSVDSSGGTVMPTRFFPGPVIEKVDTIFSLVARPLSDINWVYSGGNSGSAGEKYDFFVDLIFTPVVTLHNPYNVNISFQKMQVTFTNIPVAFQYMFQSGDGGGFTSQSVVPGTFESLNTMAYNQNNTRNNKSFVMKIANWQTSAPIGSGSSDSSAVTGPIIMTPGQTLICGPFFPPQASFKKDAASGSNTTGFDWQNTLTNSIKAKPNFIPGLGFEVYAVTPGHIRLPGGYRPGGWSGHPFMMLRDQSANPHLSKSTATDQFYLQFKIQRPSWYNNDSDTAMTKASPSFAVTTQIQATANGAMVNNYAKLQFDYKDETGLQTVFKNQVYRYPPTGSLSGKQIAAPGGVSFSTQGGSVQSFAIFSAYARTTNGGVYETRLRTTTTGASNLLQDGRLAGKPFLFHNPANDNVTMNLATDKPGVQSYELNFQPFLSQGNYQDYMAVDGNRVPSLTANTTTRGIKSGSYLELPLGPMQTIADFRRSNALTSSYLPAFVQPIGNSLVHPLMSTNQVIQTDADVAPYPLLDHSVLANHALYDRFYFSTFATRGSVSPDAVFEQFMNSTAPLASQAYQRYLPAGKTVATAKAELFTGGKPKDTAYQTAAKYQLVQGPFNVNSTRIQAWKARLAAMNKNDITTLWSKSVGLETKTSTGIPILGMSLPNGGVIGGAFDGSKIDDPKTNEWNGYRQLTDSDVENLASKIVDEVRLRGPFLSMSEFVNRQVGANGPLTRRGALEAAIETAEINKDTLKDYTTPITLPDISDPKLYKYNTPEVSLGNPAAGAPGWISQGDLLRVLEPSATVRGDTFVIRVYGEAKDSLGNVIAHAYAEAVVQRVPEYLNPVDQPSLNVVTDASASLENKRFGRRMKMVSFRWLTDKEI